MVVGGTFAPIFEHPVGIVDELLDLWKEENNGRKEF